MAEIKNQEFASIYTESNGIGGFVKPLKCSKCGFLTLTLYDDLCLNCKLEVKKDE